MSFCLVSATSVLLMFRSWVLDGRFPDDQDPAAARDFGVADSVDSGASMQSANAWVVGSVGGCDWDSSSPAVHEPAIVA